MKKQATNSLTLDQKVLYKRFALKLKRSEVAHAKLFGNKDLIKQLSQNTFSAFSTTVTDKTDQVLRVILQHGQDTRRASAPSRLQFQKAFIPLAGKKSEEKSQDEQEKKDASTRGPRVLENEINLGIADVRKNSERGYNSTSGHWWGAGKQVHFDHPRPHTSKDQKFDRKHFVANYSLHMPSPSNVNIPGLRTPVSLEGRTDNKRLKGHFPRHSHRSGSSSNYNMRPRSRNLFLWLGEAPVDMPSFVKAQAEVSKETSFNDRVNLFIQKVIALKYEEDSVFKDYYAERLLEKSGRNHSMHQDLLKDMQEEQNKWNFAGTEPNHRSITIKKLDRNFIRNDVPPEILTWEYYNEILTKENQVERKWLNNNPNHRIIE
ncbi:hypothetical protein Y1Q_0006259 [Alligator mississippiensis]|uniref:Uncharacterized protein n=1 Tax=Alligator mississippiensis TaxID=8496 RepID=A0A151NXI4_ALLMI|nr:hypothetical protein Y1Q_0006259 [Alligator mississippiensis]